MAHGQNAERRALDWQRCLVRENFVIRALDVKGSMCGDPHLATKRVRRQAVMIDERVRVPRAKMERRLGWLNSVHCTWDGVYHYDRRVA